MGGVAAVNVFRVANRRVSALAPFRRHGGEQAAGALGGYAGLRESDIIRATWAWYDGTGLTYREQKTGADHDTRAHIELRAILDEERRRRGVALGDAATPLVASSKTGGAFTESGFRASFF